MDTTVKKIDSRSSPRGPQGELQLVCGKAAALRAWREDPGEGAESARPYETLGYVIRGRAELEVEGQTVRLGPGDSWLVPAEARHRYRILESFEAVEATAPPAHLHGAGPETG